MSKQNTSRAVSVNFEYALSMSTAIIILGLITGFTTTVVTSQSESISSAKANIVVTEAASEISAIESKKDQIEGSESNVVSIQSDVEMPKGVSLDTMQIVLATRNGNAVIDVQSSDPDVSLSQTRKLSSLSTSQITESTAQANNATVIYDGNEDEYSIRGI